jgi:DNA-binding response OmpR family regulator
MVKETILVVDDDPAIRTLLGRCFADEGFTVVEAADAATAVNLAQTANPDLITLDIHLGQGDGFDVARQVRRTSDVPIIMVTGKNDVIDRIVGLELGADDYITKPFHLREVVARIRSVLRRAHLNDNRTSAAAPGTSAAHPAADQPHAMQLHFDGLTALPDRFELRDRCDQPCDLTSGDFKLLDVFLRNPKRILSREKLMDLIGGPEWPPLDLTIDNQVARLRKKIERDPATPTLIKTVRGVGYMFACDIEVRPMTGS